AGPDERIFPECGVAAKRVVECAAVVADTGEGICKEQREVVPDTVLDGVDRAIDLGNRRIGKIFLYPFDPVRRKDAVGIGGGDNFASGGNDTVVSRTSDLLAGLDKHLVGIL